MIQRSSAISLLMACIQVHAFAQLHPDWENPAVFQRNQEPPHATLMPYDNMDQALAGDRKSSPNHYSLNGIWKFNWAENPAKAPGDFHTNRFDRSDWDEIRVPSNWQMEGFGYPLFRNIGLPFGMDPPGVPEDFNPVGSYYRTFELPGDWEDKQVFLHFEGVHSASYVWINDKEVGYNQGGMEPAEYDVTPYIRKGENAIAVKVLRYSDGAYMEDQDTWRLSGIYRDVYLMATPKVHIRDFYVVTDLDDRYRDATLRLEAEVRNYSNRDVSGHSMRVTLYDPSGRVLEEVQGVFDPGRIEKGSADTIVELFPVSDPQKWSAEYPRLHTLVMELIDDRGRVTEVLSTRVGFREVEVQDGAILVNGVPVKFNGVNSHMLHPETGHTMDVETLKKDLHLMKRFNINCVRTSHYPPNVEYLDLADRLGIYVVDETGDEAHAYIFISHMPEWRAQYLDRMRKMVYRDRNHPSVVIWSAGNESGPGENLCALMEEGKRIDPSRPAWMYGGNDDRDPDTNPIKCEDIVGPRYLEPFALAQLFGKDDDPRPSFMDEYLAATGNSMGGLDEYWELIYRYPRLTGGAIWDWISPGITQPVISTADESRSGVKCVFMNKAHLVQGKEGMAMYLSGHDDWLEIARDPALDINGNELTISFMIKPEPYNGHGYYLTKGDFQYGIVQPDADHLEFYVHTGERVELSGRIPGDWTDGWHRVTGIYDGKKLELYVDGKIIGTRACRGEILNGPYPVNIGKSSEIRDNHRGYLAHATIDAVRIFDSVVLPEALDIGGESLRSRSLLWLDFETANREGDFWSVGIPGRTYGLVWPDRSVQPELWQLKKSPQPVQFRATDLETGAIEVINRYHFRNLTELDTRWELTANGEMVEQGSLRLDLAAGASDKVRVPFSRQRLEPGRDYHLLISSSTKEDTEWAKAGHEVAWEQFQLPVAPYTGHPAIEPGIRETATDAPTVDENDESLVVEGDRFRYVFDRNSGYLESMEVDGQEILRSGPRLNFWRAPLANDLDSWSVWHVDIGQTREGMGREIANGWRSIGLDRLDHDVDRFDHSTRDGSVEVTVEMSLHTNRYSTGFKAIYRYNISGDGEIRINTHVSPHGALTHWLPKVGLQMELQEQIRKVEWYGRGPFETYPDRKTGAKVGVYRSTVDEDYVPYIIPQDYGNKTDVRWIRLTDSNGAGLHVSGGELFNASVQKFTTENLDRAHYTFQLKEEPVVTLNLDHRVSGVGDTSNSTVNKYRVLPAEYDFTFVLRPLYQ